MTRICLTTSTVWYVDYVNGNDTTGDGSQVLPWKTAQHAFEQVQNNYDGSGYGWTIQLVDGDHYVPSGLVTFCALNGAMAGATGQSLTINILGNRANPANCRINLAAGQYGFSAGNNVVSSVYGFKFICPTSGGIGAIPFFFSNGGASDFGDIIFGANPYNINVYSVSKGTGLFLNGTNSAIIGNTPIHYASDEGGVIKVAEPIDIPNALNFSVAFAQTSYAGSFIALTHATYTGANKNNCTGKKGRALYGSGIRIDGDTATMLGNTAATYDTFGSSVA